MKDTHQLSSNKETAEKRFNALQKRLQQDDNFRDTYEAQMIGHVLKSRIELAPDSKEETRVFYLPQRAVKKECHGNVKWRIVFDASARNTNHPSLNDVLEMGPNLLPEVLAVLLRFRSHPVGIIGDGQQAFLQLSSDCRDR